MCIRDSNKTLFPYKPAQHVYTYRVWDPAAFVLVFYDLSILVESVTQVIANCDKIFPKRIQYMQIYTMYFTLHCLVRFKKFL